MYAFLTAIAGLVTINSFAVIAAERYWGVVKRKTPNQRPSKLNTSVVIIFVWVYSITWAIFPIIGWGSYVLDGIGTTCTFDFLTRTWENITFVMLLTMGNFFIPLVFMLFCYIQIWKVKKQSKNFLLRSTTVRIFRGRKNYTERRKTRLEYSISNESETTLSKDNDTEDELVHDFFEHVSFDQLTQSLKLQKDLTQDQSVPRHHVSMENLKTHDCKGNVQVENKTNKKKTRRTSGQPKLSMANDILKKNHINGTSNLTQNESTKYGTPILSRRDLPLNIETCNKKKFLRFLLFTKDKVTIFSKKKLCPRKVMPRFRDMATEKIIVILISAFAISWTPYLAVCLVGLFGDQSQITYEYTIGASLVAKTSMVFNPILYSFSHPKVRKRIYDVLYYCKKCNCRAGS